MNQNDEIIIVDDCSNDQTVYLIKRIFQKYNNLNKKLFINKINCGPMKSFEKALNKVSNDIIVLIDQDDIWFENRLNKIKTILSDFDFCTLNSYHWNEEENKYPTNSDLTFNIVNPSKRF